MIIVLTDLVSQLLRNGALSKQQLVVNTHLRRRRIPVMDMEEAHTGITKENKLKQIKAIGRFSVPKFIRSSDLSEIRSDPKKFQISDKKSDPKSEKYYRIGSGLIRR